MWIQSPGLPVGWEEDAINLICVTLTSENQRQDCLPLVLHWQIEQSVQNPDLIMSLFSLKSCNIYLSLRGIPSKLIPWHLVLPSLLVNFISCFPQESQSPSYPRAVSSSLVPLPETISCPAPLLSLDSASFFSTCFDHNTTEGCSWPCPCPMVV